MIRNLILGTAGHIDHGKTSLVKVLTGVDCDRLPEEKARGITIDIGFAHLDLGETRIGIIDCPGHERFVKNMLAGSTGIDIALLIIAADDSIMPQTREHLDILQLLGIRHGIIALTKADLVDETTRDVVMLEIRELVQETFLANAPIIPTSATKGLGISELKEAIAQVAAQIQQHEGTEWFRLPIDRSFVVQGHGTVVTGSLISGTVRVGDELEWLPSKEIVRVRSLQSHDHAVEEIHRGQRAAINLAGVAHEQVKRGQELARPGYLMPSKVLTVRLNSLKHNRRPMKHRAQVRLHIGTIETLATLSLLDCDSVESGQWSFAQLFCEQPVTSTWGQPFVIRDSSAEHTIGGGNVLQPNPIKIRRRHIEVIERVEKLWSTDPVVRVEMLAWFAGYLGFTEADVVRGTGIAPDQVAAAIRKLQEKQAIVELSHGNRKINLHGDRAQEIEGRILETLAQQHQLYPLMTNHDRQKVLAQLNYISDDTLLQGVTNRLIKTKQVVGDAKRIARADFKPKLTANQRKLKDQIVDAHRTAAFQPPDPGSFAAKAGGNAGSLKEIFEVACAEGLLVRVNEEIYLHADVDANMQQQIREKLTSGSGLTVAEIRDLLGTTRKYAVPLCEYLDRTGLTRRDGDLRVLNQPS